MDRSARRRRGAGSSPRAQPRLLEQRGGEAETTGCEGEASPPTWGLRGMISMAISAAIAVVATRILAASWERYVLQPRPATRGTQSATAFPRTTTVESSHARLAVCAAVRDSPENIVEWVRYHHDRAIGVDKFYLMVTDDPDVHLLQMALQPYISESIVELYDLPYVNPRTVSQLQVNLYARCLDSVRDLHDYVGFWDVDEFIVPLNSSVEPFREFLGDNDVMNSGGVALNWRIVGPSGHDSRPLSGGILENYRQCTPWSYAENEEIKSIVRTKHAVRPLSDPHTFEYEDGYHAVDPEKRPVEGGRNREGARSPRYSLYHFVTKSREEYREKMRRGSAMGNRKDMSYFDMLESIAVVPCGLDGD